MFLIYNDDAYSISVEVETIVVEVETTSSKHCSKLLF